MAELCVPVGWVDDCGSSSGLQAAHYMTAESVVWFWQGVFIQAVLIHFVERLTPLSSISCLYLNQAATSGSEKKEANAEVP